MGTRRVVTGHDENGKAIILMDYIAPNEQKVTSQINTSLLWITEETPADNSGQGDAADQEIGIPPPLHGSIFRVVEFKPENEDSGTEEAEFLRVVGTEQPENARHPGMHRTRSVDYAVIISGEIDLLLDDDEVHLKAGDVVVQRGTNHAWVNRGTEPCAMAFVLLDAKEIG